MDTDTSVTECWKTWSGEGGRPGGNGNCCCNCKNHVPVSSHPWVDKMPCSHQAGWVCINEILGATLSNEHGLCELHERGEHPCDERVIARRDMAEANSVTNKVAQA